MENQSRTVFAARNFMWSTVGNIVTSVLSFVSRTVFIYALGETYLGVSGLFSNVLGVLSLAELGVGTAIGFSLYKPLAEKDYDKIQALINFYRTAYRIIALIVACIGVVIIPFLGYIVKGGEGIAYLEFIYCIYLFNTVTSYLIAYKTTLLSADQRTYWVSNINLVSKCITVCIQITVLLAFKNFILYLLTDTVISFVTKCYQNYFVNRKYPFIAGKNNSRLSWEEKHVIFEKIKALMMHQIGSVAIFQTDNIITSSIINVGTVGLVENYTMIINMVNNFINSFFNSAIAGLGNMIATEGEEKRFQIFKKYDFLGFWFFGWSAVCLYILLSPFISLWIGRKMCIDGITVALLTVNYYLSGQRLSLGNIKSAAGVYEPDKWSSVAQAAVNIVVSVAGAYLWGLKGVYIGTLASSMIPNIVRPCVVYKYVFHQNAMLYFREYIKRIFIVVSSVMIIHWMGQLIVFNNMYVQFIMNMFMCAALPNIIFFLLYRKTEEFAYVKNMLLKLVRK